MNTQIKVLKSEKTESWRDRLSAIDPNEKVYVENESASTVQTIIHGRMKRYEPEMKFITKTVHIPQDEGGLVSFLEITRTE